MWDKETNQPKIKILLWFLRPTVIKAFISWTKYV